MRPWRSMSGQYLAVFGLCFRLGSPLSVEYPGNANAEEVEQYHWRGEHEHVGDVGGRRQHRGYYEDNYDRVAPDLQQQLRGHQSKPREEERERRHFENKPQPKHDRHYQLEIIIRGHQRPQVSFSGNSEQKISGARKGYVIGKGASHQKENRRHHYERRGVLLFVRI